MTKKPKGIAFIDFENEIVAETAIQRVRYLMDLT